MPGRKEVVPATIIEGACSKQLQLATETHFAVHSFIHEQLTLQYPHEQAVIFEKVMKRIFGDRMPSEELLLIFLTSLDQNFRDHLATRPKDQVETLFEDKVMQAFQ